MSVNQQIGAFLKNQLEARSIAFGRSVGTTAQTLRAFAEHLRSDSSTPEAAGLFDQGAVVVERFSAYFEAGDLDEMLSDAESFGRERPLALASMGAATGLLAARLVKSTAARRQALADADAATRQTSGANGSAKKPARSRRGVDRRRA